MISKDLRILSSRWFHEQIKSTLYVWKDGKNMVIVMLYVDFFLIAISNA